MNTYKYKAYEAGNYVFRARSNGTVAVLHGNNYMEWSVGRVVHEMRNLYRTNPGAETTAIIDAAANAVADAPQVD